MWAGPGEPTPVKTQPGIFLHGGTEGGLGLLACPRVRGLGSHLTFLGCWSLCWSETTEHLLQSWEPELSSVVWCARPRVGRAGKVLRALAERVPGPPTLRVPVQCWMLDL